MRTVAVAAILAGFIALAVLDLTGGSPRVGVASLLLGVANALLLLR